MASNYTIVLTQRQHFGNDRGTFNDVEPEVPFAGEVKEYTFACPNVNPNETAVLMFQSRDIDHQKNMLTVNGVEVFGGLPASPARDAWNGNVLLLEPRHGLKPVGNTLRVLARDSRSGGSVDMDDFIIDNVVVMYKTR